MKTVLGILLAFLISISLVGYFGLFNRVEDWYYTVIITVIVSLLQIILYLHEITITLKKND